MNANRLKLTAVSTFAGFNPLAPATKACSHRWEVARLADEIWGKSQGRFCGIDLLPCANPGDPAQVQEFGDLVAALRKIGYTEFSTFIFTPGPFDLSKPETREAGRTALLDQVKLCNSIGATFAAGPVTEGWVTDLQLGDVSDAEFDDKVTGPVSKVLAWLADEASKTCSNVKQLMAEYLCRREFRRSTRPSRIARVVKAANAMIKGHVSWTVLQDTSHLWDWAACNGKTLADVEADVATTRDLPTPLRRHLSAVFTRGVVDSTTPMPTKKLMDMLIAGKPSTWAIEVFPWWDEMVRGAISGFGAATYVNSDIVGVHVRAARFVDELYPVA